jgi:hypothetical protein
MSDDYFDELTRQVSQQGVEPALEALAARLTDAERFHDLFDTRLLAARWRLGLPAVLSTSLDDLPEPQRSQLETAYLAACREVGQLFFASGQLREAWLYLRPVGDKAVLAAQLETYQPVEGRIDEFVEVAVHQGVAPRRGIEIVLAHYGTCNAITTIEGGLPGWPTPERQAVVELLVRRVHQELREGLVRDIERQSGQMPTESTIAQLIDDRDWLFGNDNYHLDTSHLNATVRLARVLTAHEPLTLALDLTHYGRRLSRMYRYPGEEPFVDVYPTHALFFAAQLGQQTDQAIDYFRQRAEALRPPEHSAFATEVYVTLLSRLGRQTEAFQAAAELIPTGVPLSGLAPSLLELARQSGQLAAFRQVCRQRDDVLGFAAGLVQEQRDAPPRA